MTFVCAGRSLAAVDDIACLETLVTEPSGLRMALSPDGKWQLVGQARALFSEFDDLATEFRQFTLDGTKTFSESLKGRVMAGLADSRHDNPIQTTLLFDHANADGYVLTADGPERATRAPQLARTARSTPRRRRARSRSCSSRASA